MRDMDSLNQWKRMLIAAHPTFFCPVSKEILDFKTCHIVSFLNPKTNSRVIDLLSHKGFESLDEKQKTIFTIVERVEDL